MCIPTERSLDTKPYTCAANSPAAGGQRLLTGSTDWAPTRPATGHGAREAWSCGRTPGSRGRRHGCPLLAGRTLGKERGTGQRTGDAVQGRAPCQAAARPVGTLASLAPPEAGRFNN